MSPQEPTIEDAIGVVKDNQIELVQEQSDDDKKQTDQTPIFASATYSYPEVGALSEYNADAFHSNTNETSDNRAEEDEADGGVWKQKYANLLAGYNEQHDELEDLKEELEDLNYFMGKEQSKAREMKVANCTLQEDLAVMRHDRDKLFEECITMKTLLASRDKDVESLVAQVNLLIQVGTIKRRDSYQEARASLTDVRSPDSPGGMMRSFGNLFSSSSQDISAGPPARQGRCASETRQVRRTSETRQVKRTSESSVRSNRSISFDQTDSSGDEDDMPRASGWRKSWRALSEEADAQ
mmetsp:Transcript_5722/g.9485  ORF Transcript_5722/g.9485 Transcript_5722/m.9485 type:complete len:296 (+) Transcript_5722:130-1017(+)|eukprot:CAMPEP_0119007416 /NCGR_PEP_ID=MMETSP1176-20130426/2992_1 /TAXON_ID=265551 /ORGANISM="Synedropsis recta cf, Strain CCMP1620" /LENGTH=295 /DNA_ID=CAMNT_0006959559 /DNA_START=120 /DNA_END=1007 /DNA_ORIENTATION=+